MVESKLYRASTLAMIRLFKNRNKGTLGFATVPPSRDISRGNLFDRFENSLPRQNATFRHKPKGKREKKEKYGEDRVYIRTVYVTGISAPRIFFL